MRHIGAESLDCKAEKGAGVLGRGSQFPTSYYLGSAISCAMLCPAAQSLPLSYFLDGLFRHFYIVHRFCKVPVMSENAPFQRIFKFPDRCPVWAPAPVC